MNSTAINAHPAAAGGQTGGAYGVTTLHMNLLKEAI
jgi:hypothetical protein